MLLAIQNLIEYLNRNYINDETIAIKTGLTIEEVDMQIVTQIKEAILKGTLEENFFHLFN